VPEATPDDLARLRNAVEVEAVLPELLAYCDAVAERLDRIESLYEASADQPARPVRRSGGKRRPERMVPERAKRRANGARATRPTGDGYIDVTATMCGPYRVVLPCRRPRTRAA
jgi:hypothetical protein